MTTASVLKTVLARGGNLIAFITLSLILFAVFLLIPVWTIPGNTVDFQFSLYLPRDYLLTGLLALLTALFLVLQVELFRQHRSLRARLALVGKGGAGGAAGLLAAILATAACASCVAVLLGFLGTGVLFALLQYRWYVVLGASLIMLASIALTLRHLSGRCPECSRLPETE